MEKRLYANPFLESERTGPLETTFALMVHILLYGFNAWMGSTVFLLKYKKKTQDPLLDKLESYTAALSLIALEVQPTSA